ncbi:MAG: ATP-binding protein [Ferruginibacter sp.]
MKKIFYLSLILSLSVMTTTAQNNYADSLKQKLASAKEDADSVNLLSALARFYNFFHPDTAEIYARQGLKLARKINSKRGEGECMMSLCLSFTFSGNYTSALDYGLKASPLLADLHDTVLLVWNNIQIMTCYRQLEDYDQALIFGYNAKRLMNLYHSDSNQLSVGLGVIGYVYDKKNQLDSALYYEQNALALDTSWSQLFQYIGEAYTKTGHSDSALHYYKRGLSIAAKEGNNSIAFVGLYNDISKVFESTGQIDSAIFYANKSILQPGVKTNLQGLLEVSSQLARLYEIHGRPDSTIKYLKAANTLKDSLFSRKKTREAQNFAFNEKLHQQDLVTQHQKDDNKIRVAVLLAVLLIFLLIAFFLWRNNQQKQKAKNKIEKAYSDLKATQSQLIQQEKMASLGQLTAGIAHEIQNPLNFVNNFSEVNKELLTELKEEAGKGNMDEVKAIANDIINNEEKINHHGKRADAIVKGMLQHSRSSTGQKEPTDINALADEYLRLSYHGLRAKDKDFNATIKTDFDKEIKKIYIIPQDIGIVLLNLFNNAFYAVSKSPQPRKDSEYKPLVTVTTGKIKSSAINAANRSSLGAGVIEIKVSDNGNGIPQNIIDKIFQPFFTTKPTGEGTGLGLSLSYDIIKAHGGEIKVETKEGEGTSFAIVLPIV